MGYHNLVKVLKQKIAFYIEKASKAEQVEDSLRILQKENLDMASQLNHQKQNDFMMRERIRELEARITPSNPQACNTSREFGGQSSSSCTTMNIVSPHSETLRLHNDRYGTSHEYDSESNTSSHSHQHSINSEQTMDVL